MDLYAIAKRSGTYKFRKFMDLYAIAKRSKTYKFWNFSRPTPRDLAQHGFEHRPVPDRAHSPRVICVACGVKVWPLAENEHPGYWHLKGCEYESSTLNLIASGWKKPTYWELPDSCIPGYEDVGSDWMILNEALNRAFEKEEAEQRSEAELKEARFEWTYKYQPLNKEKKEIRVLVVPKRLLTGTLQIGEMVVKRTVLPEDDNMFLVCAIRTFSLDDMPLDASFEALSYTWGPNSPLLPLYILDEMNLDAKPAEIRISPNLNSALRHIRVEMDDDKLRREPLLYLWVDALCINQKDNVEKSWQVNTMHDIYRRASRVNVWLGAGDQSSNTAMEVLQGMRRVSKALEPFREKAHAEGLPNSVVDMTQVPSTALKDLHPDDLELAAAFGLMFKQNISVQFSVRPFPIDDVAALFQRSYWSRIWVLQEYAAAQEIVIVCGMKRVEDGCFRTFMETWDSQTSEMVLAPRGIDHRPWTIVKTREDLANGEMIRKVREDPDVDNETKKEILDFIAHTNAQLYFKPLRLLLQEAAKAQLEATNPLDKVYALLNLATDRKDLGIEVDYTTTATELYMRVARTIYNQGALALLAYCGNKESSLPSWVPNFSGEQGYIPIRERRGHARTGTSAFDASLGNDAMIVPEGDNPRILRLSGVMVDTVAFVDVMRAKVSRYEVTFEIKKHIIHWLRQAYESLSSVECEAYPTTELRRDAAWKTPILDHFRLGQGPKRAGPEAEKGYDALLSLETETLAPELTRLADIYFSEVLDDTNGTKPFRTSKGYVGLGQAEAEEGDKLVVFLGCEVPFLLRKKNSGYRLVGEAYVHGIMYGELFAYEQQATFFELA